jgi:hypothetical protein
MLLKIVVLCLLMFSCNQPKKWTQVCSGKVIQCVKLGALEPKCRDADFKYDVSECNLVCYVEEEWLGVPTSCQGMFK